MTEKLFNEDKEFNIFIMEEEIRKLSALVIAQQYLLQSQTDFYLDISVDPVEQINSINGTHQCIQCKKYFNDDDEVRGACYGNYVDCYYNLCIACNPVFDVAKDELVCLKHLKQVVKKKGFKLVKIKQIPTQKYDNSHIIWEGSTIPSSAIPMHE